MEHSSARDGLCICGCGDKAEYGARHVNSKPRLGLTTDDYIVEDCGFDTPCWVFKNRRRPRKTGSYNMVRIAGKQVYAHRAMYLQEVGPIPDGLYLDHLCRERRCIRTDHLEPVTHAENIRRAPKTKLTKAIAAEIRDGGENARVLAERYGVTEFSIYQIRRGATWTAE